MSGRMLPGSHRRLRHRDQLAGLPDDDRARNDDTVLSIDLGRAIREDLEKLPVDLTYREYEMGHKSPSGASADIPRGSMAVKGARLARKSVSQRRGMKARLERYFEFAALGTDWRTELLAGFTTFITMAYIVFVNPSILQEAGMPFQAVASATCVSAGFGSLLMGAFARYPIALAPGMGLNAYFT